MKLTEDTIWLARMMSGSRAEAEAPPVITQPQADEILAAAHAELPKNLMTVKKFRVDRLKSVK